MPTRRLGKNGPRVSALGLGAMGLSIGYGTPASDEERFKVLDRGIGLDCTFFDSAVPGRALRQSQTVVYDVVCHRIRTSFFLVQRGEGELPVRPPPQLFTLRSLLLLSFPPAPSALLSCPSSSIYRNTYR